MTPHKEPAPDTAPGPYYVSSIRDGRKWALLSGPYATHAEALALVRKAAALCVDIDPWAAFDAFGTVRMAADYSKPGRLQIAGFTLALEEPSDVQAS